MASEHSASQHWTRKKEARAALGLRITMFLVKAAGGPVLRAIAYPVSFFYWIFVKNARRESKRFLRKASAAGAKVPAITLPHITSFSLTLIEKMEGWAGKVDFDTIHFQDDDVQDLVNRLEGGGGALILTSHLGNVELLRALVGFGRTGVSRPVDVNTIVDFDVTANFNKTLNSLNPKSMTRLISARDVGPDTMTLLEDRIAAGDLVLIACDRTKPPEEKRDGGVPARRRGEYIPIPFLGQEAPFSYGPFFLAALLNAPTYMIFGLRQKALTLNPQYDMHVHKSAVSFDCTRSQREGRILTLAEEFARLLEGYCKQQPLQWYNFFDFWSV